MILQYIDWNVRPQIFHLDSLGFELRWYSLLFALGFLVGYYMLSWVFKREKVDIALLDKLTFYVILATILGARLGHCIFYEPEVYLKAPLKMLLPFEGTLGKDFHFTGFQGLASHGGALGLFLGLWMYSRKFKLPYIWVLDRIAIVTAFAASCIRFGNLFNSEIYGHQTSLPWGFRFLRENYYYGTPIDQIVPKHPTQIYEGLVYLLVFFILLHFYVRKNEHMKQGFYIGLFFILVFTARFLIEFIKEDQVDFEAGMALNMGQILSIPFVLLGFYLVFRKAATYSTLKLNPVKLPKQ